MKQDVSEDIPSHAERSIARHLHTLQKRQLAVLILQHGFHVSLRHQLGHDAHAPGLCASAHKQNDVGMIYLTGLKNMRKENHVLDN